MIEELLSSCWGLLGLAIAVVLLGIALAHLAKLRRGLSQLQSDMAKLLRLVHQLAQKSGESAPEKPAAIKEAARQAGRAPPAEETAPRLPEAPKVEPKPARPVPIRVAEPQQPTPQPAVSLTAQGDRAEARGAEVSPAATASRKTDTFAPWRNVEIFLGTKMLAWVGILVLLVASVLFIIWAHQQHLLSDMAKVLIHVGVAAVLLVLGEWTSRKKWIPLARTFTGGGIAEFLFANFAALALYDLIGWTVFIVLMSVIVAAAILLAVRYNSLTISIVATLAGVAMPVMLWNTKPDFRMVFAFLAGIDIGVMILAWFRRWRTINLIAFVGTVLNVLLWLGRDHDFRLATETYPEGAPIGLALAVIGGFFALFLAVSLVYHLGRREERPLDLPVFLLNPLWAYPTLYVLFNPDHHAHMAPLAASLGALYLILGALIRRYVPTASQLYTLALVLGVGFVVLAVPIQFDGLVIPMTFALLAFVLYVAAELLKEFRLRIAGFLVYLCTAVALLWAGGDIVGHTERTILNQRFMTLAACILSLALTALVIRRSRISHKLACSPGYAALPALLAHGLVLLLFSLEVSNFYFRRGIGFGSKEVQLICSVGYVLYAVGLLLAGFGFRQAYLRLAALILFCLAMGKIFTADLRYIFMTHDQTIWNLRFAVLAACILWLALAAVVVRRYAPRKSVFARPRHAAVPALLAHGLVLLLFTLETRTFFAQYRDLATGHLARQMIYSIGYVVYAAALLAAGFFWRRLYLRVAGLVLFGGMLLKVFLYDLAELEALYRIASFLGLAVLLLVGAYLYNKYQHLLLPQEPKDEPAERAGSQTP